MGCGRMSKIMIKKIGFIEVCAGCGGIKVITVGGI